MCARSSVHSVCLSRLSHVFSRSCSLTCQLIFAIFQNRFSLLVQLRHRHTTTPALTLQEKAASSQKEVQAGAAGVTEETGSVLQLYWLADPRDTFSLA